MDWKKVALIALPVMLASALTMLTWLLHNPVTSGLLARFTNHYCEAPLEKRQEIRVEAAAALAPNAFRIICEGDQ